MSDKLILEIFVQIDRPEPGAERAALTGPGGTVVMIPFTGTAKGEIFEGVVLPGGVDTQVTNLVDVRHMSARYMLSGVDYTGQKCHIYLENNGYFTNGERPSPFITVPTFYTDSEALAPYLHCNRFRGEGHSGPAGPTIKIFDTCAE